MVNDPLYRVYSALVLYAFYLLQKSSANAKVGFSKAMSNGWLRVDKSTKGGPRIFRKVRTCVLCVVILQIHTWCLVFLLKCL